MRLYIAEKPSVGRAIASVLPGGGQRMQGYIQCGPDIQVSWCVGHLLEPSEPAIYNPQWKSWRLQDLPIIPVQWKLTPRPGTHDQLRVLQTLLQRATEVIHAGDPDREGQLLVDELLHYCKVTCPVQRVLINDMNPDAIKLALIRQKDNRHFSRLCRSALARQRADWLFGLNLTRAFTLQQQQKGGEGVYSVGRVQTPVLGLVVERDTAIAHFTPRPFFLLDIDLQGEASSEAFRARWQPGQAWQHVLDEEDRLLDRPTAEQILQRVLNQTGQIIEARFREKEEPAPLPWSLSTLQIEAARLFRISAQQVLDTAQSLYEKHRLITYPRSDCRHLPEGHFAQRAQVMAAIAHNLPALHSAIANAEPDRRSKAWDDGKVDAHHAIIPTLRQCQSASLSAREKQVYDLICRQYLMQFYPPARLREGLLVADILGERFRASETGLLSPGWKTLLLRLKENDSDNDQRPPLPRLTKGASVTCLNGNIGDKLTQPPKPFTDATLLAAMTHIARYVDDPDLRKTLRDTDGLGTEATRASIIEILFKREYLHKEGRWIHATDKGKTLIAALPRPATKPDMTAVWEATLETIRHGQGDMQAFLSGLTDQVHRLLQPLLDAESATSALSPHCPRCRSAMRTREGRFGAFWACTRFPSCKGTRALDEKSEDGTDQAPIPCPVCFSPLVRRNSQRGWFWGCSSYPGCRQTFADQEGQPVMPVRK